MDTLCLLLILVALVSGQSVDEISDISSASQQDQHEGLQGVDKAAGAGNGETGSWSPLEAALMSINYENSFRVFVYEKISKEEPEKRQFYYSPALIIDPSSAISFFNNFTKKREMTFRVLMWDEAFETFVRDEISRELNTEVSRRSVSVLPIEEIRIDAEEQTEEYQVISRWIPYKSQPSTFQFRFVCSTKADCDKLAELVKANPSQFVSDLTVYFDVQNWVEGGVIVHEDHASRTILKESVQSTRLNGMFRSRINVLGSYSSSNSILDYRAEVYRMKNELLASIVTLNSTQVNSTLDLNGKVKDYRAEVSRMKNELLAKIETLKSTLLNSLYLPCAGTVHRVTGSAVEANSANAPNGVVCVGNTRNPSPSHNFLVYNKVGSQLNFLGTQSLRKGFIDFTPYVAWSIPAQQYCTHISGGCEKLPNHLRGLINGGSSGWCSSNSPSGLMYLACSGNADTLVDDDGAITVLTGDTTTLWY